MDKTLAWLWLADAVGSACQYAQELLTLYPDPAELYDALRAGTEAPPACLTPHALAQLRDTTLFDYEERLDHCLLSGIDVLTPDGRIPGPFAGPARPAACALRDRRHRLPERAAVRGHGGHAAAKHLRAAGCV